MWSKEPKWPHYLTQPEFTQRARGRTRLTMITICCYAWGSAYFGTVKSAFLSAAGTLPSIHWYSTSHPCSAKRRLPNHSKEARHSFTLWMTQALCFTKASHEEFVCVSIEGGRGMLQSRRQNSSTWWQPSLGSTKWIFKFLKTTSLGLLRNVSLLHSHAGNSSLDLC